MTYNTILTFPKEFDRLWVGFDQIANRVNKYHKFLDSNMSSSYPHFNLKKVDENTYVKELAIAGFSKEDLDISLQDNVLTIKGEKRVEESNVQYIHRGIANRSFTKSFILEENIVVKTVDLVNGILTIVLELIVPEEKKPKKIEIG
jgi:molecular chaperone IbpA